MSLQAMEGRDIVLTAEYYQTQDIMQNIAQMKIDNLVAFVTKHDPDTMYFHQAVKQPDATHLRISRAYTN
eukprot:6859643-Ditylum_brightwellii.AAC.1